MRKTHVTDKHAVNHFITNLNDARNEPVRETQHILVLSQLYIHKTITIFPRPKKDVLKKYI